MFSNPDREFSTVGLHENKRLNAWREIVSDVFFNVEIDADSTREDWIASIAEFNLQGLGISEYQTESARGIRSRQSIAAECDEFYLFVFPRCGTMYFSQYAREGLVAPGQYVMLRSSDFYQLSCDGRFSGIFLKIPTNVIDSNYGVASRHCSNWRPANLVMSKLVLSNLIAISGLTRDERTAFGACLHKQLLSMIVMMLQTEEGLEPATLTTARQGVYHRLTRLIEARYPDECFGPAEAASELKVSVGYMHRCVKANGTSFSRLLRDTRLARSFEMLHDNGIRRQVGEIAYLNGFSDHSIFSKAFRQRYGKTPSEFKS